MTFTQAERHEAVLAGEFCPLNHLSRHETGSQNDQVPEGASTEQRPVVSANAGRFFTQAAEDPIQLPDRRLLRDPHQGVCERDQQLSRAVAVGVGVGPPEEDTAPQLARRNSS